VDVPVVLTLIRELAEYERLLHEVVATEALVETALFGPKPVAECALACVNEAPVGFALYFPQLEQACDRVLRARGCGRYSRLDRFSNER
jgi:hypothetical protein